MIYLLILILAIQGAQLYLLLRPKKVIKETIVSSKGALTFTEDGKVTKQIIRQILCPVCNRPVTTRLIKRRDGILGCEICSSKEAA